MIKRVLIVFALLLAGLLVLSSTSSASAFWLLDSNGQLFFEDGFVLGKKDTNPGRGSSASQGQDSDEDEDDEDESGPGRSTSVTPKGNRANLESRGKRLNVNFNGLGSETEEGTPSGEFDIEDPEDDDVTTVKANGNAALVIRNKIAAQTHFPLMVNLDTNELIVTTPHGEKIVTILPDKAVENMLAANVLDQLGGKGGLLWLQSVATPSATPVATGSAEPEDGTPSATATPSATPESSTEVETDVTLTTDEDGTLVYEIEGYKNKKFLALFDVQLQRVVIVSAETGELIKVKQNFPTRLLDLLSI